VLLEIRSLKSRYDLLVQYAKDFIPNFEEKESFGHTVLQGPISALNMIYPNEDFDEYLLQKQPEPISTSSGFMGITSIFGGEEKKEEDSVSEESSPEESSPEESSPEESSSKESSPEESVPPIPPKRTYSKEEITSLLPMSALSHAIAFAISSSVSSISSVSSASDSRRILLIGNTFKRFY
jgi:hypothetical protein